MRRFLYLLAMVCCIQPLSAQTDLPLQYDTLPLQQEFIAAGNADYHSNALRNELTGKLLYGGFITNAVKDASRSKHRSVNQFGLDLQTEFEYRNYQGSFFGNQQWGWLVKAGAFATGGTAYSKDAYGLLLYGNDSYLGKTADLSGTSASFMAYEKIGFGAINKQTKSSVVLNVVNVSAALKGKVKQAELNTSADGANVNLLLDGELVFTEKARFSNGLGLAVDLDFRIPISWTKGQTAYIQIMAKNLGFAYMYKGLKTYSVDSNYYYDGFDFDQLTSDQATFSSDFSILDSLGISQKTEKRALLLPGFIQIGKIVDDQHAGAWQSFFGVRLYPTLPYNPMPYAGVNWRPVSWLNVGLSGCYNGFGVLVLGAYGSFNYQQWALGIGTEDAFGAVSRVGLGKSLNLRLRCKF
jgi:hypothetical protein